MRPLGTSFEVTDNLDFTKLMLVYEVFPELTKQILHDLRRLKRTDLAAQVMKLTIVDRCRCGSEACGTLYTQ